MEPFSADSSFHEIAATIAAAGIVRIHAVMMLRATPQRTAEKRRTEPTPMMAPVIVWVVETGIPAHDAPKSVHGPGELGARAADRLERRDPHPIVRTIRHPPARVPRPIAAWQRRMIQKGISTRGR